MYWLVNPNGPVIPAQGQGSTTISINVDEMSVSSMKESTGFMYIHMGQADSANYQNTGSGCSVQIPYAAYMFPAPYQYINDALNLTPGNFGEPQDYEAPMAVANNNSAYVCSGALVPNRNHPGSYNVVVTVNPVSTN